MEKTLFYAWQNDTEPTCNRYFIRDSLKKALAQLSDDESVEDSPRLDHDTAGVPGTPTIADTIFEKIEKANIFVADVTFVGSGGEKKLPNPNVMIELGYALHALSSDRVLLVMNTAHGGTEHLPFDLRNRRFPTTYCLEAGSTKEQKRAAMADLTNKLSVAIGGVLKIPEKKTPTHNLNIQASPTRLGKKQCAHLRLFNSGPGPILVESSWVAWDAPGRKGGQSSFQPVKGKLPVRIDEQDTAELLVEIGHDLEAISELGVIDGERHVWKLSEPELRIFKHQAISHRLPATQPKEADQDPMADGDVEVKARVVAPAGGGQEELEVSLKNLSSRPINIVRATLAWEYNPPRWAPTEPGKPKVAEAGASASLTPRSRSHEIAPMREPLEIGPGEEVSFILDGPFASNLVEVLRGDVRDEDISITFATPRWGIKATMEEIPSAVRRAATSILERLQRELAG